MKGMRFKKMKTFKSRPTTDFAKEGLFNVLENTTNMEKLYVLDLFAGLEVFPLSLYQGELKNLRA